MLEFHGWLTVSSSPEETDTEEQDDETAVDQLRNLLGKLDAPPGLLDMRTVNDQTQLHFGGFVNHFSDDISDLLDAVRQIAKTAPGSYGIIYLHDDEDSHGHANEFRVLVIARGNITEHQDPFLSPVVPVIESPS